MDRRGDDAWRRVVLSFANQCICFGSILSLFSRPYSYWANPAPTTTSCRQSVGSPQTFSSSARASQTTNVSHPLGNIPEINLPLDICLSLQSWSMILAITFSFETTLRDPRYQTCTRWRLSAGHGARGRGRRLHQRRASTEGEFNNADVQIHCLMSGLAPRLRSG